ncbi:response regulator [Rhodocyclus tenuis]|uniref:response regulator n=1 Tax=Rhodocyclus tenuis TaxID=1066 RepID=UPI0019037E08|nr:response regulator [Rhodocyclus tenuis]MBK1681595.1 hypothetical protein [Rhodocyclus tenuis]
MRARQTIRPCVISLLAALSWLVCAQLALAQPAQKTLRVVGDENYPPYLFLNADGKEEGFLVDVWKLWEAKTGIRVELKALKWELAQRTLLDGGADVIENIFATPGRAPYYEFSRPYADLPVAIYRDVSISGVTSLNALRGFKVGVMEGDACIETLKAAGISSLVFYGNYTRLIQGAMAQDVKVFCLDEYPANFYLYQQQANRQFAKAFELGKGQFHRAVRKGDVDTLRLVEQGMAAISDAEIESLREKWLRTPTDYQRYYEYAGIAVAVLVAAAALLALWIFTLRRTVAERVADIRRAEEALLEREEQLRSVGNNLPGGFVYQYELSDSGAGFRYISAGVVGLLELTPEAVLADPACLFACVEPEAVAGLAEAEQRSAQELTDFSAILPIRVPSGKRKWLHVQSRPRCLAAGGVVWDGVALDASERMEVQNRLAESESRFRRLFEDTRQPILIYEGECFVAANRAALDTLRLDGLEQFLGQSPADISPEFQPDGQRSAEKVRQVVEVAYAKGSNEFEWEHVRADGEPFTVWVLVTPIRMGGKDVLHVVWRDITGQKKTEQELAGYRRTLEQRVEERTAELEAATARLNESNTRLQAIFDGASAGIMLTRERRIEQCNRRLEQMFGYDCGGLDGQFTRVLFAGDRSWEEVGAELYAALAAGEAYVKEQQSRCRDGSMLWVRVSARSLVAGDPGQGVIGMLEDITAARESAEALRKATDELQAVFDAATVGVMLSRNRVIQRCNRTMETLFGYAPDELLGRNTRIFYPDEQSYAEISERLLAGVSEHGYFREESQLVRKDGSRFWCRKMVQAVDRLDPDKGLAGTFEDITVERQALDEIVKARRLAEDAAKTKSDFLATMSHEIRTPMNSVIGMTHLALKAAPPAKVRDYLCKIESSSQMLLGVINDILDISKLEAHGMTLEQIDFDLEKLLDDVAGLFSEKTASRGVELIIDVDSRLPLLLVGDALRLRQVLVNLTGNAVKFTERGQISLNVLPQELSADSVLLRFEVCDTGIGIRPEQRKKLFQAFQQADTSVTRKYGGTGLGLAIAERLVQLMGGTIGFDSTPDVGSRFWFSVRLDVSKAPEKVQRRLLQPDLCGLRVLVVDDNDMARQAIGEMVRSLGVDTELVDSGAAALQEIDLADAAGKPYALILLDWQMPGGDGVAVAREIQRRQLHSPPVVLMVTAFDRARVMHAAAQVGIRDVLVKPVTPSALFDALTAQLGGERGAAAALAPSKASPLVVIEELAGARALLVEDNELNREVATEFLSELGLHVDYAENGEVALHKLQQHAYDVVLMDLQMPVMDGITAAREIRKLPLLRDLPILAMTANAMPGDRAICLEAGMNEHIAKPIDPADLVDKLRKWVKPAQPGGKAEATHAPAASPEVDAMAALLRIEGLDVRQGVHNALGRESLYLRLLAHYCAGQYAAAESVEQALQAGRIDDAQRVAHTLKSVSAQIGATRISDLAGHLESLLRQNSSETAIRAPLEEIARILPGLIGAISRRLPQMPAQPAAQALAPQSWQDLREKLSAALIDGDFSSLQLFDDNAGPLRAALGIRYAEAAAAVSDFRFAEALAIIDSADPRFS